LTTYTPADETELAELMRTLTRVRLRGGGTVATAGRDGADVSLEGLTGVVEHRPDDLVATARAGTPLRDVTQALAKHWQRFPLCVHDPDGRATIGGVFAAAADGLLGTRAWRARDILLGARAVLPGGDVVQVGARVVKSVAGFDVCKALVGSRGTLAAITEVTFRVEAIPAVTRTLVAAFEDPDAAHVALAAADRLALQPRGLTLLWQRNDPVARVALRLEGDRRAVEETAHDAAEAGFIGVSGDTDPFQVRTALFADAAPQQLSTGPCSRARPIASRPPNCRAFLADTPRARFIALPGGPQTRNGQSPLWEPVRRAFDPDGVLEPGRGPGAP
jgi:FAD/FMN-containing dehydrogenase